jgi:glycosyltransferase involved in cell wall biosynthesis
MSRAIITDRPNVPQPLLSDLSGTQKRVLFIQHAGALSGSIMSLLYTIRALDRTRLEPVVALIRPNPLVASLYHDAGVRCIEWPGISTFEHTTLDQMRVGSPMDWVRAINVLRTLRSSIRRTHALIDAVMPDIVHLNSVVLAPSAMALRSRQEPWVWHVREAPVRGTFGLRTRALRSALGRWPDETLFISDADRRAWLTDTGGVIVHNFVDHQLFDPVGPSVRQDLGIYEDAPVIVFLGGISQVKGVMPLLDALAILRDEFPGLRCIMPGAVYEQSRSLIARAARTLLPLVGRATWSQQFARRLHRHSLEETCVLLPFRPAVAQVLRAADVVVFPALRAHFPRPAVEAAALGKPVVASRLPGIDEIVIDGETGLLAPAGDAAALAREIRRLLLDPGLSRKLGESARQHALERFDATRQVRLITEVYERVLASRSGLAGASPRGGGRQHGGAACP